MGTYTIQQGHVARTRGATGAPGEQAYAVAVAGEAARRLRDLGHTVHVIGADTTKYPLCDRQAAVHYDGSTNPAAYGASVGYRDAAGQAVAHAWKVAYQRLGHRFGFRPDNYTGGLAGYYGNRRARASSGAFILEGGFGSHPEEGAWCRSGPGITACAQALVAALTGRPPGDPSPPTEPTEDLMTPDQERRIIDAIGGVWHQDVHGRPAGNRLHDIDVHADRVQTRMGLLDRLGRESTLIRRAVRAIAAKLGLTTAHEPPAEVEA